MTLWEWKNVSINGDVGNGAVKLIAQPHVVDGFVDVESPYQDTINVVKLTLKSEAAQAVSRGKVWSISPSQGLKKK